MSIEMGWPEWIVCVLLILKGVVFIERARGKPRPQDGPIFATAKAFYVPMMWVGLLYWGGFFS